MRRAIALAIVLVVCGFPLIPPRAAAQVPLGQEHLDRPCGFSFRFPTGWSRGVRPTDRRVIIESPDPPETSIAATIGPIQDVTADQVTTEQVAQSIAAHNCLFCLRGSLVWIDRFTVGNMTATYIVQAIDLTVRGQPIPHYVLEFFVIENGTARGLIPRGWTQADVEFQIRTDRFRAMEPTILSIVQSLRFTVAERPQQECWPRGR